METYWLMLNIQMFNYKDGLCIGPGAGLVKSYPHVPGIDFSGVVEHSETETYKKGDKVILTGWRVGEVVWGGYSQKARVKSNQLVKLPQGMTTKEAMSMGTAGFSAMLSIMKLGRIWNAKRQRRSLSNWSIWGRRFGCNSYSI